MTIEEKLDRLAIMLEEDDAGARTLTDAQMRNLLDEADGDLRKAAYLGAIKKARCTALTLPDGVSVESMRQYWLTVARSYRGNYSGCPERQS